MAALRVELRRREELWQQEHPYPVEDTGYVWRERTPQGPDEDYTGTASLGMEGSSLFEDSDLRRLFEKD